MDVGLLEYCKIGDMDRSRGLADTAAPVGDCEREMDRLALALRVAASLEPDVAGRRVGVGDEASGCPCPYGVDCESCGE